MLARMLKERSFSLGIATGGLLLGLFVWTVGQRFGSAGTPWGPQALQATATHAGPNFIMATGQIDDSVEGVFFLDRLTGMLQCWVISKNHGGFVAKFGYENVFKDIGADVGKVPDISLVTGGYQFVGGGAGGNQPANCLVYVLNDATGAFAVYSIPWNAMFHNRRTDPIVAPLAKLNSGMIRNPDQFRPQ